MSTDIKFVDTFGTWQNLSFGVRELTEGIPHSYEFFLSYDVWRSEIRWKRRLAARRLFARNMKKMADFSGEKCL